MANFNDADIPLDDLMAEMENAENNAAATSQAEEAKAEEPPKTCKETALQLVSLGFIVAPSMPCGMTDRNDPSKPAKNPVGAWKDSKKPSYCICKSAEDVERLWKKHPRANVGVFCGGESGIYCLDIDRKVKDGKLIDGFKVLRELGHDLEKVVPSTIVSRTPSGGWHVYFKCSGSRKIWESQEFMEGLDIRGECTKGGLGGFAVEAPSCYQIPATKEIKHYEWIHSPSEFSILECPDWLLDLADKATEREKRKDDKKMQDELPKQEKPAEDSLFDEDSPDFKKAVEALTRMPESISGSDAKSRHQPEVAFLLAVRVCRWNCSLNRSATWKAINTKSSTDAKSWNERCVRADKTTPWPWTREEFDHKFDDVEATPEKVRFMEDAERKDESAPPPDEANGEEEAPQTCKDVADWLNEPDEPDNPLIEQLIEVGSCVAIVGPAKAAKSYLVILTAICIAAGVDWFGRKTKQQRVYLVNVEMSAKQCKKRIRAICKKLGVNPDSLRGWLFVDNLRGMTASFGYCLTRAKAVKAQVVFIDPFYQVFKGKETDEKDCQEAVEEMKPFLAAGMTLFIAFHAPKGFSGDRQIVDMISGSSVLVRFPENVIAILPHAKEKDVRVVDCSVLRDYSAPEQFCVKFEDNSLVLAPEIVPELRGILRLRPYKSEEEKAAEKAEAAEKLEFKMSEVLRKFLFKRSSNLPSCEDVGNLWRNKGISKGQWEDFIRRKRNTTDETDPLALVARRQLKRLSSGEIVEVPSKQGGKTLVSLREYVEQYEEDFGWRNEE